MELYDLNIIKWGMKPTIETVSDVKDIHQRMIQADIKVATCGLYGMPHYRGEQKFGWDLLANVFRIPLLKTDKSKAKFLERAAWQEFEAVVKANFGDEALRTIFDNEKHGKDWDLLMQAQHATIKTSLLDWTPEVYSALYFATEESKIPDIEDSDAQFWVYMVPFENIKSHNNFPVKDTFYDQDPQNLNQDMIINVSIFLDNLHRRKSETRMFRQKGRFYASADTNRGIEMNNQAAIIPLLFRFRIPAKNKPLLREELKHLKVDEQYLFGDINPAHQALMDNINKRIYS